jgi:hypothetical protein
MKEYPMAPSDIVIDAAVVSESPSPLAESPDAPEAVVTAEDVASYEAVVAPEASVVVTSDAEFEELDAEITVDEDIVVQESHARTRQSTCTLMGE